MPRTIEDLKHLPPSELKSLSKGEFKVYCGVQFETLEKSGKKLVKRASNLNKCLWCFLIVVICMLAVAIISVAG